MKVAIAGGGWYGCHLAKMLNMKGIEVDLYESGSEIFSGASSKNQNRLHNGFHYPRDYLTRRQSLEGYYYFLNEYGEIVEDIKDNVYAISRKDSLIDFETYKLIMANSGGEFEDYSSTLLNSELISGAIKTNEKLIRNDLAKKYFDQYFKDTNVDLFMDYKVKNEDVKNKKLNNRRYDFIINATWGAIQTGLLDSLEMYYEPCIYFYYSSFDESRDFALTVMDGKLFSLYPYEKSIYTLTSVEYTPIVKTKCYNTAVTILNDVTESFTKDRQRMFEQQACAYIPEFKELYKFEGVELSLKTKIKTESDSRYCIVKERSGIIDIFSGKIDTINYAEKRVLDILGLCI